MAEPFLAEIRIFGFNFPPRGWAQCDGQILPINQNQSLYSLLGTTYGGDGRTSFALPGLRGRTPIHVGSSNGVTHTLGQKSGQETVILSASQMPQHTHRLQGETGPATTNQPLNQVLATGSSAVYRSPAGGLVSMNSGALASAGANQAHNNMQPYQALNFCIALLGLFPSRN